MQEGHDTFLLYIYRQEPVSNWLNQCFAGKFFWKKSVSDGKNLGKIFFVFCRKKNLDFFCRSTVKILVFFSALAEKFWWGLFFGIWRKKIVFFFAVWRRKKIDFFFSVRIFCDLSGFFLCPDFRGNLGLPNSRFEGGWFSRKSWIAKSWIARYLPHW